MDARFEEDSDVPFQPLLEQNLQQQSVEPISKASFQAIEDNDDVPVGSPSTSTHSPSITSLLSVDLNSHTPEMAAENHYSKIDTVGSVAETQPPSPKPDIRAAEEKQPTSWGYWCCFHRAGHKKQVSSPLSAKSIVIPAQRL